jgi:hypothetical protein
LIQWTQRIREKETMRMGTIRSLEEVLEEIEEELGDGGWGGD